MNGNVFKILVVQLILLSAPAITLAAGDTFTPFQQLPFISSGSYDAESYVNALYRLSISLAAVLVVLRIIMAGVKYMFSEVVTKKEEARNDIKGALIGLLIILGATLILRTINPEITKMNFLNINDPASSQQSSNQNNQSNTCLSNSGACNAGGGGGGGGF